MREGGGVIAEPAAWAEEIEENKIARTGIIISVHFVIVKFSSYV
jgi:hypothetical protein